MNYNTYTISDAEQLHNLPEEIGLLLLRFIHMLYTLLRFPLDEINQVVNLHFIAATDGYGLLHISPDDRFQNITVLIVCIFNVQLVCVIWKEKEGLTSSEGQE